MDLARGAHHVGSRRWPVQRGVKRGVSDGGRMPAHGRVARSGASGNENLCRVLMAPSTRECDHVLLHFACLAKSVGTLDPHTHFGSRGCPMEACRRAMASSHWHRRPVGIAGSSISRNASRSQTRKTLVLQPSPRQWIVCGIHVCMATERQCDESIVSSVPGR